MAELSKQAEQAIAEAVEVDNALTPEQKREWTHRRENQVSLNKEAAVGARLWVQKVNGWLIDSPQGFAKLRRRNLAKAAWIAHYNKNTGRAVASPPPNSMSQTDA